MREAIVKDFDYAHNLQRLSTKMTSPAFFSKVPNPMIVSSMKHSLVWPALVRLLVAVSYLAVRAQEPIPSQPAEVQETHLQNVKQLTFGGENAEAYFSCDGNKIIF